MFKIEINTGNNAFDGLMAYSEIARLLRETAERVMRHETEGMMFDLNGNRCGSFSLTED